MENFHQRYILYINAYLKYIFKNFKFTILLIFELYMCDLAKVSIYFALHLSNLFLKLSIWHMQLISEALHKIKKKLALVGVFWCWNCM